MLSEFLFFNFVLICVYGRNITLTEQFTSSFALTAKLLSDNYEQYYFDDMNSSNDFLQAAISNEIDNYLELLRKINGLESKDHFLTKRDLEANKLFIQDITESGTLAIVNIGDSENGESVDIWRFDVYSQQFNLHQVIYVTSPISVDTILYKNTYYLAIASGRAQNAMHSGLVDIREFDFNNDLFTSLQDLTIIAPISIAFAKLPTAELVLYVLTESPAEPIIIYEYQGITGFVRKIIGSTISKCKSMKHFTTENAEHFLIVNNDLEVRIIQANSKRKGNLRL